MTKMPLIVLAVILIGLVILFVQNLSPSLPLVFLGMRTQPLPLALWIVFSMTAGGLTSFLVSTLFKLTNIFGTSTPSSSTSFSAKSKSPRVHKTSGEETIPSSRSSQTLRDDDDVEDNDFDDWNLNNSDDDWDFSQTRQTRQSQTSSEQRTPKTSSDTDSVYSYSSQTPKNTSVGKTESVYDADYRVIIPPYQPSDTNQNKDNEDDDWSFFEDDEEDDQNNQNR